MKAIGWTGRRLSFADSIVAVHSAPHPELLCRRSISYDVELKQFATRAKLEAFINRQDKKPRHYTHWIPVIPIGQYIPQVPRCDVCNEPGTEDSPLGDRIVYGIETHCHGNGCPR